MADPNITEKKCCHCEEVKPLSAFKPNKNTMTGVGGRCRTCLSARLKEFRKTKTYYEQQQRLRETRIPDPDGFKTCIKCLETKPSGQFSRQPASKDGLRSRCKACGASEYMRRWRSTEDGRKASNLAAKRWRQKNPDKARTIQLRSRLKFGYGLSLEEFNAMNEAQNGVCAICRQPNGDVRLVVDHCHTNDKVRSLLCDRCNHGLGSFADNPERMEAAAEYIRHHRARLLESAA